MRRIVALSVHTQRPLEPPATRVGFTARPKGQRNSPSSHTQALVRDHSAAQWRPHRRRLA
jgi:hypothetical protein